MSIDFRHITVWDVKDKKKLRTLSFPKPAATDEKDNTKPELLSEGTIVREARLVECVSAVLDLP